MIKILDYNLIVLNCVSLLVIWIEYSCDHLVLVQYNYSLTALLITVITMRGPEELKCEKPHHTFAVRTVTWSCF